MILRYFSYFLFVFFSIMPVSISAEQQKKVVLSSFSIIGDMTKNIAKNLVKVVTLVQTDQDSHSYQITSADAIKIQSADLILCNGLHLEETFMKYFTNLKKDTKIVTVTDGIKPISVSEDPNVDDNPNPHAWMSLTNAMIYIENIRKALESLDPSNAEEYARNAREYAEKIQTALLPLKNRIDMISPENRWFVTSEGCLVYLAKDFGFNSLYLWPINSDSERSPLKIRDVINKMRFHKIKFIYSESTNSDQPAKQVAYETNASYGGVLYVDSLSKSNGPASTYLDLLKFSVTKITDNLSQ
ncbi:zinc ABC transporter substrate-binding protein [Candidatus Liberibacter africanus]|uniref:Periplasmic solute binding protein n=1 Tax=Candidatus Liberibacter africanus PTSAPSY TaxID=1277257 RepID=A0A0G3I394_LIBAF|nr:zinc ABC transporter substrate-binding protein [Candidatus Liberibacter africanus]AKK20364.1 periplasmic solute binding protein [Candidatus Liberibacter africanus PTSAPSY]QTP64105.1 zinc ABC transporter substrate-binding protein [Candidatus Liberibacter africanus]